MHLVTPGQSPSTWDDGTQLTYMNWQKNKPANNSTKMCVFIHGELDNGSNQQIGFWNNVECDRGPNGDGPNGKAYPICMKAALPGHHPFYLIVSV